MKWPKILCKDYASTVKILKSPKHFMAFFENFSDYFSQHCEYAPYLRWSHGEKSNYLVQLISVL